MVVFWLNATLRPVFGVVRRRINMAEKQGGQNKGDKKDQGSKGGSQKKDRE